MTLLLLLVAAVASIAFARHPYEIPGEAETLLTAPFQTTFSCEGRPYGYYADVDNNCEVFHVCFPITEGEGNLLKLAHFTIVCGNQTIFNQDSFTCATYDKAVSCEEAPSIYELRNSEFGIIPEDIA